MRSFPGLRGQVVRYLAVGAVNTVLSYGIFILLGLVIPPGWAYTTAYLVGLVWVVLGSSTFVFGGGGPRKLALFACWYLGVFAVGQLVVHAIQPDGLRALLVTSAAIITVTVPLSFVGGRYIFRPARPAPYQEEGT